MEQFIYIIPSVGFTVCFDRNSIIKCPGYLILDTPNIHNTPFPYAWPVIPGNYAPLERSNGQSNMTIHRKKIKKFLSQREFSSRRNIRNLFHANHLSSLFEEIETFDPLSVYTRKFVIKRYTYLEYKT